MACCENIEKCLFLKKYKQDEKMRNILVANINAYCRGDLHIFCKRKIACEKLGGQDNVPLNMLPSGAPLVGTTDAGWADDLKAIIKE